MSILVIGPQMLASRANAPLILAPLQSGSHYQGRGGSADMALSGRRTKVGFTEGSKSLNEIKHLTCLIGWTVNPKMGYSSTVFMFFLAAFCDVDGSQAFELSTKGHSGTNCATSSRILRVSVIGQTYYCLVTPVCDQHG